MAARLPQPDPRCEPGSPRTPAWIRRLVCRLRGHDWRDEPIRYEYGRTTACNSRGESADVPVTWVCDEVCCRCGGESWWPA